MSDFVFDWILEQAEVAPSAKCLGTPAGWLSYGEVASRLQRVAGALQALGVKRGDRVILALPNVPATVIASYAVQLLGAAAVELSREWSAELVGGIAAQTGARLAIAYGRDAATWAKVGQVSQVVVVHPTEPPERLAALLGGRLQAWLKEDGTLAGEWPAPAPVRDLDAMALLVYTSGSTGAPRGVIQTHKNIAANTHSIVQYLKLTSADRVMSVLPLFYCYGKSLLQTHLYVGGSIFFDERFMYPRVVMEALGQEECTGFAGVPLTFELIRRQVDLRTVNLRSLRYLTQAGGAMRHDTIHWVREAFAPATLYVMYGQTEATARLSYLPPEHAQDKFGSIGRGIPNVLLRVVDEAGKELPPGEVGHLVARGDNVSPGYFMDPAGTAEILHDGWLWTGDLARRDGDGFLYIAGRSKEMLKLGGHRVSPMELEEVLGKHPDVVESAVVGVPDELGGEAAHAFVVRRPGAQTTEAELKRHCRDALPAFKVPKEFTFAESLPRTHVGKLARAELKARLTCASPKTS